MDKFLSTRNLNFLKYVILCLTYIIVGSLVIIALENNPENREAKERKLLLQQRLRIKLKTCNYSSGDAFDTLAKEFLQAYSQSNQVDWDFKTGYLFVFQLISTIGYGNMVPTTQGGRLFSVIYAFFGIIITVHTLHLLGQRMFAIEKKLVCKIEQLCLTKDAQNQPLKLPEKCLLINAVLVVLFILIGAALEAYVKGERQQDWTFIDGVYAWFITFTTIGFGDMIPTTLPHWVFCLYTLIGLCNMSCLLNAMAACPHLSVKTILMTCVTWPTRRTTDAVVENGFEINRPNNCEAEQGS